VAAAADGNDAGSLVEAGPAASDILAEAGRLGPADSRHNTGLALVVAEGPSGPVDTSLASASCPLGAAPASSRALVAASWGAWEGLQLGLLASVSSAFEGQEPVPSLRKTLKPVIKLGSHLLVLHSL
jgi:hypothetical protein